MSPSEKKPRARTHLTAAVPGALGAVLLIGAVAFGATALRGMAGTSEVPSATTVEPVVGFAVANARAAQTKHDPDAQSATPTSEEKGATPSAKATLTPDPAQAKPATVEPIASPKPQPIPTAKPAPTKAPAPPPSNPTALVLEGWAKDSRAKLAWKPYQGTGFEHYKVVRSGDGMVTWPTTGGDELVGVIGDPSATWFADKPPCGTPWFYAVFAVRGSDAGYVVLAASNVVSITTACAPEPTPVVVKPLDGQAQAVAGQGILLTWQAYAGDGFSAYKVVRSLTNADPRYPLNDGTELIGVIGDPWQTSFLDTSVTAGQTWTYRVLAVTSGPDGHVVIGETPAVSATAQ